MKYTRVFKLQAFTEYLDINRDLLFLFFKTEVQIFYPYALNFTISTCQEKS